MRCSARRHDNIYIHRGSKSIYPHLPTRNALRFWNSENPIDLSFLLIQKFTLLHCNWCLNSSTLNNVMINLQLDSCNNVTLLPTAARVEGCEILSSGKQQSGPTRIIETASHQICPIFTTFRNYDTNSTGHELNPQCLVNTQNTILWNHSVKRGVTRQCMCTVRLQCP